MKQIKQFIGRLFFHPRFYQIWAVIVLFIFLGFWFPVLFVIGKYAFIIFISLTFFDFIFLGFSGRVEAHRHLPEKLSNGDENKIQIDLRHTYPLPLSFKIIDELPVQFQKRDFELKIHLNPNEERALHYSLKPVKRGVYEFGKLNVFFYSPLKLAGMRKQFSAGKQVKVYPSFIQMRKYELLAFSNKSHFGIKRVRRLGHTMEFEQIKVYNEGDDYRTINWKSTAKHQSLMVNQYQDEKSQNVYALIDMGRTMELPFNQMTLLDYAINATLSFSNIAMKKKDKMGLLTFEKRVKTFMRPGHNRKHLQQIFEQLYQQKTHFYETDFERLYRFIRHQIPTRSLLMLYSNFEHINSLKRQMPYLKKIAQKHLLVVIFFENTELKQVYKKPVADHKTLYHKIIIEDFNLQKKAMVKELHLHKIHTVLTEPENLTAATINKYLKLKARGLI